MENREVWKDCKGYEGLYQVSNKGRVWSIRKQRIMYQKVKKNGYSEIHLTAKNGKLKYERVHRLVALAFLDNPNNYPVVNHINGIKTDNSPENLEWCSVRANTKHAYDNNLGNFKKILKDNTDKASKVNTKTYKVYKNDVFVGEYQGLENTAAAANVSKSTVRNCINERRKSEKGYSFKVKEAS